MELKDESDFNSVLKLIKEGKNNLVRQANTILIDTYWNVGAYLSKKVKSSEWGKGVVKELALYIKSKDPQIKGFNASNMWRMKD